jgi:hypothetical protein
MESAAQGLEKKRIITAAAHHDSYIKWHTTQFHHYNIICKCTPRDKYSADVCVEIKVPLWMQKAAADRRLPLEA